jgi:hypothetical protein
MKKPYKIKSYRAVKQLDTMAADGKPAVQMVLPLTEMVGWLRKGVGEPRFRRFRPRPGGHNLT